VRQRKNAPSLSEPTTDLPCFDKLFPSKTDKMIESETVQKKQPSADTRNVTDRSTREVTKTTQDELTRPDESKIDVEDERNSLGLSLSKIFNRDPGGDFQSRITELKAGNSQKMVFLLENSQIWLQDSPRTLPFRVGDTVKIKKGLLGGYTMRSKSGTSTRVQRIR
jgi:hypothetical protein